MALIQVSRPMSPNLIYTYLYIIFGTLGVELLLWTSLPLITCFVINMCLLVFALTSFGVFLRAFNWLQETIQPFADVPFVKVYFGF
ncbi:hypothetical protein EUGRSUZ_E01491 [Eucalyptus grandis]|uniref:Uncharacterized protein n=2 Tax=Eucalyptus grandis TaxID=71139 RepID=A0A059C542_EUCGR|nr:hypothetical protein EUGRSUZ_E01491 [Eucalyptus grandis]